VDPGAGHAVKGLDHRAITEDATLSNPSTPYRPSLNNLRGILWMLAAVTALTCMFAIIKHMLAELPVFVVAILRTFLALVLMAPWMMQVGIAGLKTQRLGGHFWRAFFGTASFVCVVYALSKLLMADAIVLSFTSPLWAIIIAAIVLREIAGPRRIAATVVGFLGVLLIVKPQSGFEAGNLLPSLIALASALLTALAMSTMKRLSATEPPTRIVFYFFLLGTLMLLLPAIATWQTPTLRQFAWLSGAGLLAALGQDWLTRAYDAAELTVVAPLDFLRPPIAAVLGFALFQEVPDRWTIIGMGVIIASCAYIARREAIAKRAATAAATARNA
jgi:drug/metabolite transporter (DMT)-like permease